MSHDSRTAGATNGGSRAYAHVPVAQPADADADVDAGANADADTACSSSLDRVSWRGDARMLLALAVPSSAIYLVQFLVQFSSVLFIGRLGPDYLGAATLANMLANLTGFSLASGATTALDALCAQAYGARSYALVGRHTQRAMLILSLCSLPCAAVWWHTATLLGWMGVEARICALSGRYTRILIAGMLPNFMFECLRKYLQTQSIMWPIVVAAVVTAGSSLGLNYLMMFVFHLDFAGPAISSAMCQWIMCLSVVACIIGRRWWRRRQATRGQKDGARDSSIAGVDDGGSSGDGGGVVGAIKRGARRMGGETYARVEADTGAASPSADNASVARTSPLTSRSESTPPASPPASPSPSPSPSPFSEVELIQRRRKSSVSANERDLQRSSSLSKLADEGAVASDLVAASSHLAEWVDPEDTWPSIWSREVLCGWGEFLKLALPGAISLFVEAGSYEVSAGMAARLGSTNLAVHSIFMQTASLFYNVSHINDIGTQPPIALPEIPLGTSTACSISIGQFLGAGRGDRAQDFARMGLVLHAVYPVLAATLLVAFLRPHYALMFTSDALVAERAAAHLPIFFLYFTVDHIKCVCMAVLRGCGRAPITVYGNTLSCWVVGFPLAYVLVFKPLQLELWGLWTAMSASWFTACVVYIVVILCRTDWQKEVEDAKARTMRSLVAVVEAVPGADPSPSPTATTVASPTGSESPAVAFTIRNEEDDEGEEDEEEVEDEDDTTADCHAEQSKSASFGAPHAVHSCCEFDVTLATINQNDRSVQHAAHLSAMHLPTPPLVAATGLTARRPSLSHV